MCPLFDFHLMWLQDAGAVALLIVDLEGKCSALDQICLPGASRIQNEGFAAADLPSQWYCVQASSTKSIFSC
jgi:hypothetical protein